MILALLAAGTTRAAEVRATRFAYGQDAPEAQVLEAHLLVSETPTPVLVYVNSGGWSSSPPKETKPGPFSMYHDLGLSAVAVCHRTIGDNVAWPAPGDDVARAVQFIRLHAKEWNIDPDRMAITGRSSGGHIAMMVGFGEDRVDPNSDDPISRQSSAVRCIIEQGGPAELAQHLRENLAAANVEDKNKSYLKGRLETLLGVTEEQIGAEEFDRRLQAISPLRLINSRSVPLLMMYTGPDDVTSAKDPRLQWEVHTPLSGFILAEKLQEAGVDHELAISQGFGRGTPRTMEVQSGFLRKHGIIESP
jgi:acetyl esterase/lipase